MGALRVSYRLAMPKFCPYIGETNSVKFRCIINPYGVEPGLRAEPASTSQSEH
jgi:hypothetical protein